MTHNYIQYNFIKRRPIKQYTDVQTTDIHKNDDDNNNLKEHCERADHMCWAHSAIYIYIIQNKKTKQQKTIYSTHPTNKLNLSIFKPDQLQLNIWSLNKQMNIIHNPIVSPSSNILVILFNSQRILFGDL